MTQPHDDLVGKDHEISYLEFLDIEQLCMSNDLPDEERVRLLEVVRTSKIALNVPFRFWMRMAVRRDCREIARQALRDRGDVRASTKARFQYAVEEFCRNERERGRED